MDDRRGDFNAMDDDERHDELTIPLGREGNELTR